MEKLTKQEEEVMLLIWQTGVATVKQVLELMPEPKPPYTTLASVFQNLKRKQYVSAEQKGITYYYSPRIGKSEYKREFMKGFVDNYFKNSFREMVAFFAKEQKITPEELQDIIDEIERGQE